MNMQQEAQFFVVEGTIQAMQISSGSVNLIEDIQNGAFWTGVAAGVGGEAGVLANSASLTLYDGEEVEHMALLINDRLAIGTFEWLRDLMIDDDVKLVVSETDAGPLFVHAILRKNDQLLWTPLCVNHTRRGWMLHGVKLGSTGLLGMILMFGSIFVLDEKSRPDGPWLLFGIFFTIALISFVVFMSTASVIHQGDYAEKIFRALGVPKADRFQIKPYSIFNLHFEHAEEPFKKNHIYQFSDALYAHKLKFNLP
ncbi:MAG: hypothetical protein V4693_22355 [Pseudomonadota bacterium]